MFKMKLQELCHQRRWALPNYSCAKFGPDHNPKFRASVIVDGVSFDSLKAAKSSKEALNEAAKLAFFRLTTGVEPSVEGIEADMSSHINSSSDIKASTHHQHKLQLQQFAQSKKLDAPSYSSKREGPPHALRFQATVTIDGHSFKSQGYFRNLKEAENAASKVALLSLSLNMLQEINICTYKNLLQELIRNEDLPMPEYKTVAQGPPHQQTFFSTVEIGGESFQGEGRKSKKLAELSAAKAAYLSLMKGSYRPPVGLMLRICPLEAVSLEIRGRLDTSDPPRPCIAGGFLQCILHRDESTGDIELNSNGFTFEEMTNSSTSSDTLADSNSHEIRKTKSSVDSFLSEGSEGYATENEDDKILKKSPTKSEESQSYVATSAPPDLSSLSVTASKTTKNAEMGNYLLCNKVRVYTSIPSTKFPEGTVILPIDDNKWVAVSLKFPNQKY